MPQVKKDHIQNIRCIVCNNREEKNFRVKYEKEDYVIVECLECTFHFIPPAYRQHIDYTEYKTTAVAQEMAKGDVWLKIQRNKLRYRLIRRYQKTGRIYDIGCGFGHFLLTGRMLGYSVMGNELSKANFDFVKNLGIPVEGGDFLDVSEETQYDIMTLWDVLEHIDEGDRIIEKAARMLKPGGYVFIQVPQIDSIIARLLRGKWPAMGLDHVNYFSRKTIRLLTERYGIELTRIYSSLELKNILLYAILPYLKRKRKHPKNWTAAERQSAFNRLTNQPQWIRHVLVFVHNLIYKLLSFLQLGDEMIVVGQKKG